MIYRELEVEIRELLKFYPVITIVGPRQSGKTTLCQNLFPGYTYVNLEDADMREIVMNDPKRFLLSDPAGMVIDEVHHCPELFSYIQVIADQKTGRKFILTGSSNFSMLENITQSLAGRTAVLTLLPFSLSELGEMKNSPAETLVFNGGYPGIWADGVAANTFYKHYYNTYVERDVRRIINIQDVSLFQRFIRLCAGRIGCECNASALAGEVGVVANTITKWFNTLSATYIVYMLQPYYRNIGKRLVKTPKIYFYDTGLVCYLLGIENEKQLSTHPLCGRIFENMIVNEAMKSRFNKGKDANLYYYRDKSQREVDLIHDNVNGLRIYEIKSAQRFQKEFFSGIDYLKNLFREQIVQSAIIYDGTYEIDQAEKGVYNFRSFTLD
jgi:predicted AAA+ superfamily ATPase